VAQGWSTTLPRWGPRVRIPSRAFLLFNRSFVFIFLQGAPVFLFLYLPS
jgi:hypothetical protein